jgi:hypothetical protein
MFNRESYRSSEVPYRTSGLGIGEPKWLTHSS